MLLCAATLTAFAQNQNNNTLYQVNVLKPKAGMKNAFEESWKIHVAKFHGKDNKRSVFEVTSGPDDGSYVIVEGPFSYADMDKDKPMTKEHDADLDKNFDPKLEPKTSNGLFRWVDSLSLNPQVQAQKFLVTVTQVKNGKMGEYLSEVKRTSTILQNLKSPISLNVLVKQQAGSTPTVVTIRNLKDGFKELEDNYFQMAPNAFRDEYVKTYGQADWDKRVKLLVDDIVSREQHFEKLRTDLSSK